jgi:hypothetical protein
VEVVVQHLLHEVLLETIRYLAQLLPMVVVEVVLIRTYLTLQQIMVVMVVLVVEVLVEVLPQLLLIPPVAQETHHLQAHLKEAMAVLGI